jgi:hypothetical protein
MAFPRKGKVFFYTYVNRKEKYCRDIHLAWLYCGNAVNSAKQQVYDLSVYFRGISGGYSATVDHRFVFTQWVLYREIGYNKKAMRFCHG